MSTLSVVIVALVTSYKGAVGVDPDQINLMHCPRKSVAGASPDASLALRWTILCAVACV